jgi:hypothetical protein
MNSMTRAQLERLIEKHSAEKFFYQKVVVQAARLCIQNGRYADYPGFFERLHSAIESRPRLDRVLDWFGYVLATKIDTPGGDPDEVGFRRQFRKYWSAPKAGVTLFGPPVVAYGLFYHDYLRGFGDLLGNFAAVTLTIGWVAFIEWLMERYRRHRR